VCFADEIVLAAEERSMVEGFEAKCCEDWQQDLHGVGPKLSAKRRERGWDEKNLQELSDDPTIQDLLRWDGGRDQSSVFPRELPWES
jgi:hypothetical protein